MPKQHSKIKEILLLVGVPIGVLALLIAMAFMPRWLAHPDMDFVYQVCDYSCRDKEVYRPGSMTATEELANYYLYDVERDSSRKLSYSEFSALDLDYESRSPGGYMLDHQSSSGLFGSDYGDRLVLRNGLLKKFVQLQTGYYNWGVEFIGWVR